MHLVSLSRKGAGTVWAVVQVKHGYEPSLSGSSLGKALVFSRLGDMQSDKKIIELEGGWSFMEVWMCPEQGLLSCLGGDMTVLTRNFDGCRKASRSSKTS